MKTSAISIPWNSDGSVNCTIYLGTWIERWFFPFPQNFVSFLKIFQSEEREHQWCRFKTLRKMFISKLVQITKRNNCSKPILHYLRRSHWYTWTSSLPRPRPEQPPIWLPLFGSWLGTQSFTSLEADYLSRHKWRFAFRRCLNGLIFLKKVLY